MARVSGAHSCKGGSVSVTDFVGCKHSKACDNEVLVDPHTYKGSRLQEQYNIGCQIISVCPVGFQMAHDVFQHRTSGNHYPLARTGSREKKLFYVLSKLSSA